MNQQLKALMPRNLPKEQTVKLQNTGIYEIYNLKAQGVAPE